MLQKINDFFITKQRCNTLMKNCVTGHLKKIITKTSHAPLHPNNENDPHVAFSKIVAWGEEISPFPSYG